MGIPVLGIPVLNHNDLLDRMLRTIDYPVDLLYVVDNGGNVPRDMEYVHLPNIFVADTGYNMGVGPSWNLIIRANMDDPWWVMSNNDIQIQPGVLSRLYDTMDTATEPTICRVAMGNEDWGNHFGLFALNAEAVDVLGWFDENLFPIYFEDTDYMRRINVSKVANIVIPSSTHHDGNMSWRDEPTLAAGNKRSWGFNATYFTEKWERLDKDGGDVRQWPQPTLERMRAQQWAVERKHIR